MKPSSGPTTSVDGLINSDAFEKKCLGWTHARYVNLAFFYEPDKQ